MIKNMYKMKIISLLISLFSIIKAKALECVSVVKIKNESMFYPNDMIQLNNFDCQLLKINKRENRENNNTYYISYKINKPEHDINSINNLYFVVDYLRGKIEKING